MSENEFINQYCRKCDKVTMWFHEVEKGWICGKCKSEV